MFLREQIDGPTNSKFDRYKEKDLAHSLIEGVVNFGWFIHTADERANRPQGYRLSSWVESANRTLGHSFAVSRTKTIPGTIEDFALTSTFFTVNRDTQTVVEEPKVLEIKTSTPIEEQAESVITTYDKPEMIYTLSMLDKMGKAAKSRNFDSEMDVHVGIGLMVMHLDTLAEMFPKPILPQD